MNDEDEDNDHSGLIDSIQRESIDEININPIDALPLVLLSPTDSSFPSPSLPPDTPPHFTSDFTPTSPDHLHPTASDHPDIPSPPLLPPSPPAPLPKPSIIIQEIPLEAPPAELAATCHEDLAPIPPHLRTWRWWNYASMWFSMSICIPNYLLGASLLSLGLNWWQSTLAVFAGSLVTLLPLVLNGIVGTRYGISFPVYLRSCFGIHGAKAAALVRGLVAVGWFSFQVWVGALAIHAILARLFPALPSHDPSLGAWMGISLSQLLCFLLFLAAHALLVLAGLDSLRWLQLAAAPVLLAASLALFCWAVYEAGLPQMLAATDAMAVSHDERVFGAAFAVGVTSVVASWSTLALNDLDFTRFASSVAGPVVGQCAVFPLAMSLVAFLGIAVTGASVVLYGRPFWDPSALFSQWSSTPAMVGANLVLLLSTLSVNLTANLVSPANDLSNLWPDRISYKTAGYITCLLGAAVLPWKLFADPDSYIFVWLIGYAPVLGAVCGIMIVDFWVVRRRHLLLPQLFLEDASSEYWFCGGWNLDAIAAWVVAPLPCVPGFLVAVGLVEHLDEGLRSIYDYSWFVAIGIASLVYALLSYKRAIWEAVTSCCKKREQIEVLV